MVSAADNSNERVKRADLLQQKELRVLHTPGNSGVRPPRSALLFVVLSQVRVPGTLEEENSVVKPLFPTGSQEFRIQISGFQIQNPNSPVTAIVKESIA